MRRLLGMVAATAIGFTTRAQTFSATPLNDLGTGLYLNQYQGGLYPQGQNLPPAAHASAGVARSGSIAPVNTLGQPDPAGKFVFLSVGMSNTSQEWCGTNTPYSPAAWSLMGQAAAHPAVDHTSMVLFNGARGGQSAATWDDPSDPNYARVQTELSQFGFSEAQVQVAWLKLANPGPTSSLPNANADANTLVSQTGNVLRSMKQHYPNLKTVFISSRIYAGYATTTLNPEPYAYESGLAVKRIIEAQINQMNGNGTDALSGDLNINTVAPWVAWGPYLWADGPRGRGDGLTWLSTDFQADGTHPSQAGQTKVGTLLMRHLMTSPFSRDWFLRTLPGDATLDGVVNSSDFNSLASHFGQAGQTWGTGDFDYNQLVNSTDFNILAGNFGQSSGGGAGSTVPEPGLASMLVATGFIRARRKSR